jgi:hypothetical protein
MSSSDQDPADAERVAARAQHLLPEEAVAGSDDPEAQAEAVLADSDRRALDVAVPQSPAIEHRTSDETVPPADT